MMVPGAGAVATVVTGAGRSTTSCLTEHALATPANVVAMAIMERAFIGRSSFLGGNGPIRRRLRRRCLIAAPPPPQLLFHLDDVGDAHLLVEHGLQHDEAAGRIVVVE